MLRRERGWSGDAWSDRSRLALAACAAAAGTALIAALALQYWGGYAPCNFCIYERYPYLAVVLVGLVGVPLARRQPGLARAALAVAAVALLVNVGLSAYHVGIEQGWVPLPESCAAVGRAASIEDLRSQLAVAPARCDQVSLALLGLSLAAWNGLLAAGLLGLALLGLRPGRSAAEEHGQGRVA